MMVSIVDVRYICSLKTFSFANDDWNKKVCVCPGENLFSLVQYLQKGKSLLPHSAHKILGWRVLKMTNTLAYLDRASVTQEKSFIEYLSPERTADRGH
jgi:hypothetical protein